MDKLKQFVSKNLYQIFFVLGVLVSVERYGLFTHGMWVGIILLLTGIQIGRNERL